jgi:hypothetical protein
MNYGDTEIPIKLGLGYLGVLLEIKLELMSCFRSISARKELSEYS